MKKSKKPRIFLTFSSVPIRQKLLVKFRKKSKKGEMIDYTAKVSISKTLHVDMEREDYTEMKKLIQASLEQAWIEGRKIDLICNS